MKRIALMVTTILALAGCSKLEVNETNIIGEWTETYEDYPYFAEEGFVSWNFRPDGSLAIHVYDVFAGEHNTTTVYRISQDENGTSVISFPTADYTMDLQSFVVTKFTKKEMEWQRVGTTFMPGTVGSDFKHFTKK